MQNMGEFEGQLKEVLDTILQKLNIRIFESTSTYGHLIVGLLDFQGSKNLVEYAINRLGSVPAVVLNGLSKENPAEIGEALRKIYEDSGVLKWLNEAGIYLRAVLVVTDKKVGENDERVKFGKYWVLLPSREKTIDKVRSLIKSHWKYDDLIGKITELSAQYLVFRALHYKVHMKDSNLIKVLIITKNPENAIGYISEKKKEFVKEAIERLVYS